MPKSREVTRRPSKRLRCAIYTRKSSDEGLEQAFNSLDAQREACAAFVLSQKHEGWSVLPALYNDGGRWTALPCNGFLPISPTPRWTWSWFIRSIV
jgi:hypothetical protein